MISTLHRDPEMWQCTKCGVLDRVLTTFGQDWRPRNICPVCNRETWHKAMKTFDEEESHNDH